MTDHVRARTPVALWLFGGGLLLGALAGCGGASSASGDVDALDARLDVSADEDWTLPDPGGKDPGDGLENDVLPDVVADVSCEPGAGGFGCPCAGNGDCASRYCGFHLGEHVCALGACSALNRNALETPVATSTPAVEPVENTTDRLLGLLPGGGPPDPQTEPASAMRYGLLACVDSCPAGFACQPVTVGGADAIYVCVSTFPHLCLPCTDDADCRLVSGAADVCVGYGAAVGRFCGGACQQSLDCPAGFACDDAKTWDGKAVRQCVPTVGECA